MLGDFVMGELSGPDVFIPHPSQPAPQPILSLRRPFLFVSNHLFASLIEHPKPHDPLARCLVKPDLDPVPLILLPGDFVLETEGQKVIMRQMQIFEFPGQPRLEFLFPER